MPKTPWRGNTRSVPQSDLHDKALGVGDPNSADKGVGKANARWARVNLTGLGLTIGVPKEVDVAHDLGTTPTLCTLESYENANGACSLEAHGTRPENWSHGHVHALVTLLAGSAEGCTAIFKLSGR